MGVARHGDDDRIGLVDRLLPAGGEVPEAEWRRGGEAPLVGIGEDMGVRLDWAVREDGVDGADRQGVRTADETGADQPEAQAPRHARSLPTRPMLSSAVTPARASSLRFEG